MTHSATAKDMLDTSKNASPTSLGKPMDDTDLPTLSSSAVNGGDTCVGVCGGGYVRLVSGIDPHRH